MRTTAILLAIALAASGAPISSAIAAAPAADEAPRQERKICRTTKMTGSLTRRTRICLTEAEWRELNSRTRKGIDEMTSQASGSRVCEYENSANTCY